MSSLPSPNSVPEPEPELSPGVVLDRLQLRTRVARGNFCEVWRAHDPAVGRDVALKLAHTDLGRRMLCNEVAYHDRLPRRLDVVPILRSIRRGGDTVGVVMPWFPGRSLRDVLDAVRSPDDRARAVAKVMQVIATVAQIHRAGLLHGDLKPENVLLQQDGRPLLTDFGLARDRQAHRRDQSLSHSLQTGDDLAGGTLAYLPPEAVKGAEPTAAGDVYALGVMLHETLLGRRPDKAAGVDTIRQLVSAPVVDLLVKALAFRPEQRFASAITLWKAARPVQRELTESGARRRLRKAGRIVLAGLAAFFVCLRYASVVGLLGSYAALVYLSFVVSPAVLLGFLPILFLHVFVRWEGPETSEEAKLRRKGAVVSRGRRSR